MFDAKLKSLIAPSLVKLGKICLRFGLNANILTVIGFGFGFCCGVLICVEAYGWAIGALLLNRMCDGLDGAVARLNQPTDFGGYLDIVCDFTFYAFVPFCFAVSHPDEAVVSWPTQFWMPNIAQLMRINPKKQKVLPILAD